MLACFAKKLLPSTKLICAARNLSLTSVVRKKAEEETVHKNFEKFKCVQKRFQVDDGRPVYLKKGASDKLLFQLSLILTLVGFGLSWYNFYEFMVK